MNLRRNILIIIMTIFAFVTTNAKIAIWSIHPKYEMLQRFYVDIYAFQQNGKYGLVRSGDQELLPAKYDFITPYINGYALAGRKVENRYLLECIINVSGRVSVPSDRFYLHLSAKNHSHYVSEGKIVVINSRGKYGYITADGRQIIKCQFNKALPFKEGWASVQKGNGYTQYINEKYDKNPSHSILPVDFHYGEMTMSSCFSNGMAVVAYNQDFALINDKGQKVKNLNKADFLQLYKKYNAPLAALANDFRESSKYSVFIENGKSGLKEGGAIIVKPQFDSFSTQYSDETLLTMKNGKYGLLKIVEGDIDIRASVKGGNSNELVVDRRGNLPSITIDYNIPSNLSAPKCLVDLGNGIYQDAASMVSNSSVGKSLTITPIIAKNAEACIIKALVENDGIVLADFERSFTVSYPIVLRVSSPGPSYIRAADERNVGTVNSTIFNDSGKEVTVTATWSTGKTETITIPAHSRRTIYATVQINANGTRNISISLNTGESAHARITLERFF